MANKTKRPRSVKTLVPIANGAVPVYAGVRVAHALQEVTADMDVYKGVRLGQLLEAVYLQGKKDGARNVRESFESMMKSIPHLNPGQPKKKKPPTVINAKTT
jgi:hypothetical protein